MKRKVKTFNLSLSEYRGILAKKEYWDDYSDEWNNSTIEEKLIRLAEFVKQGGDLNIVLNDYAEYHDALYKCRIQVCVFNYIERLISGSFFNYEAPINYRIKRLDKEELVRLLTEELKRCIVKIEEYDDNLIKVDYWTITNKYLNNDDILDMIEREHWRKFPNESFSYYLNKSKRWDNIPDHSFW